MSLLPILSNASKYIAVVGLRVVLTKRIEKCPTTQRKSLQYSKSFLLYSQTTSLTHSGGSIVPSLRQGILKGLANEDATAQVQSIHKRPAAHEDSRHSKKEGLNHSEAIHLLPLTRTVSSSAGCTDTGGQPSFFDPTSRPTSNPRWNIEAQETRAGKLRSSRVIATGGCKGPPNGSATQISALAELRRQGLWFVRKEANGFYEQAGPRDAIIRRNDAGRELVVAEADGRRGAG